MARYLLFNQLVANSLQILKNDLHNTPFQLDFPDKIKRILPSDCHQYLGIEISDQTNTLFYLYHLEGKKIVAKHIEEQKGLVLRFFDQYKLLIQHFSNTKNPDQSEIKVCKWGNNNPIFEIKPTRIINYSNQWIEVPHTYFTGKSEFIDINSGQKIKSPQPKEADLTNTYYPTTYPSSSEYFDWFESFFNKKGIKPIAQIEYLKLPELMIIGYYQMSQNLTTPKMNHHISTIDTKGKIINTFLLADTLSAIGKNTFFVQDSQLVFTTNYRTLNTYEI